MSTETDQQINITLEEIRYKIEIFKHQYDLYKHMTTLTTGALILIVTLIGVFKYPKGMGFIIVSLILFLISLLSSIRLMTLLTSLMKKIWNWNFGLESNNIIKKETESFNKKYKYLVFFSQYAYWLGMVFLLIFAGVNVLK